MTNTIEQRLKAAGITLPQPSAPQANYVPCVISGHQVFISGQLPMVNGALAYTGKVGREISADEGKLAARLCAINLIAHLKTACGGNLERVVRVVRLGIYVACTDDFTGQPLVGNGASDLMGEIFGDAGRHARAAVGTNVLPLNAPVEIDGIFEIS
jgi:enamine deaminase RidA (YjgF/YER057c/UK114 family)